MAQDISSRLEECEHSNRRLVRLLKLQGFASVAVLAVGIASCTTLRSADRPDVPRVLRVNELVVVDSKGVERVRIGGDLPDAIIGGKPVPREKAAGVLVYDGTGSERASLVTWEPSGKVGLMLATRMQQVAVFVADAEAGSAVQLWHGQDAVELRSDADGSRLSGMKAGRVAFQEPLVVPLTPGTCARYREPSAGVTQEQMLKNCARRFTDRACRDCLGLQ